MNKKILILFVVVLLMGGFVFILFSRGAYGEVVFTSQVYPYNIQAVTDGINESYDCDSEECRLSLMVSDWDFYMQKDGYYSDQQSLNLSKNKVATIEVSLQEIPEFAETEIISAEIDEAIFDTCYGNWKDCGYGDLYYLEEDSSTGHMTLWEGETRRATFTKGMEDGQIFVADNGVMVWDSNSGESYFVDFLADSREYLFNADELESVMFVDRGYVVEGSSLLWLRDGELLTLPAGWGLSQVAFYDGKVYFIADAGDFEDGAEGAVIGAYDGVEVYVILEGLEFLDPAMASDGNGVYVNDGGESWEVSL